MANTQNDFQCPNCAKLWERIESLEMEKAKLEEGKAKADRQMRIILPLLIVWFILSAIGLLIRVLN